MAMDATCTGHLVSTAIKQLLVYNTRIQYIRVGDLLRPGTLRCRSFPKSPRCYRRHLHVSAAAPPLPPLRVAGRSGWRAGGLRPGSARAPAHTWCTQPRLRHSGRAPTAATNKPHTQNHTCRRSLSRCTRPSSALSDSFAATSRCGPNVISPTAA
jgi:hypothetical protein